MRQCRIISNGCLDDAICSALGYTNNGWQQGDGRPTGNSRPTASTSSVGNNHEAAIPSTLPISDDRRHFSVTTNASYDHINDSHALTNDRNEPHHDFHQFSRFNQDMNTNLRRAEPANDDDDLYLGKFLIYFIYSY